MSFIILCVKVMHVGGTATLFMADIIDGTMFLFNSPAILL